MNEGKELNLGGRMYYKRPILGLKISIYRRSPLVQNYGVDHIFNSSYLSWEIPLANMATLQGPRQQVYST